jgi:hypothetical protein
MTHPPQGSHEPGEDADPDRHPTAPVPSFERPPGAGPGYGPPHGAPAYGQPAQGYGPPRYGAPPYGQPQFPPYGAPPPYGPPGYGQQPYGAPGSGFGPPATPEKSRVGLIVGVTAGIVALIALVVVLALTMSSTVLDRNAVQRDVAAQFEEREGVAIDLSCDDEMKVEEGATYRCTGTTADGEDVTLEIAVTDEDTAAYTWTEP